MSHKPGKSGKKRDESPARARYRDQKRGLRRKLRNVLKHNSPAEAAAYARERGL